MIYGTFSPLRQEEEEEEEEEEEGKKESALLKNVLVKNWGSNFYRHFFENKKKIYIYIYTIFLGIF